MTVSRHYFEVLFRRRKNTITSADMIRAKTSTADNTAQWNVNNERSLPGDSGAPTLWWHHLLMHPCCALITFGRNLGKKSKNGILYPGNIGLHLKSNEKKSLNLFQAPWGQIGNIVSTHIDTWLIYTFGCEKTWIQTGNKHDKWGNIHESIVSIKLLDNNSWNWVKLWKEQVTH